MYVAGSAQLLSLSRGNNSQLAAGDRARPAKSYLCTPVASTRFAFGFILDRVRRFMRPIRLSLSRRSLRAPASSLGVNPRRSSTSIFHPYAADAALGFSIRFSLAYACIYTACKIRVKTVFVNFYDCHEKTRTSRS